VQAFAAGALIWCASAACLVWGVAWLQRELLSAPAWLAMPALALALKPAFAWRMLRDEMVAVETALRSADHSSLAAARGWVARLVSRDVTSMNTEEVRETVLETLAENLNDSVVAPLAWAAVAGLPGAVLYRFANTADAMWGYRGRWEWAGKWAARADDVLSWLPARLTALLLVPRCGLGRLRAEAARAPSPNSGWPMASLALALGVRLRKPGVYALNADAPPPQPVHTARALALAHRAAIAAVVLACAALLARDLGGSPGPFHL
jgi:adenosylcobinamide-phosphate synthase